MKSLMTRTGTEAAGSDMTDGRAVLTLPHFLPVFFCQFKPVHGKANHGLRESRCIEHEAPMIVRACAQLFP